jgi:hypothetical protein
MALLTLSPLRRGSAGRSCCSPDPSAQRDRQRARRARWLISGGPVPRSSVRWSGPYRLHQVFGEAVQQGQRSLDVERWPSDPWCERPCHQELEVAGGDPITDP